MSERRTEIASLRFGTTILSRYEPTIVKSSLESATLSLLRRDILTETAAQQSCVVKPTPLEPMISPPVTRTSGRQRGLFFFRLTNKI